MISVDTFDKLSAAISFIRAVDEEDRVEFESMRFMGGRYHVKTLYHHEAEPKFPGREMDLKKRLRDSEVHRREEKRAYRRKLAEVEAQRFGAKLECQIAQSENRVLTATLEKILNHER